MIEHPIEPIWRRLSFGVCGHVHQPARQKYPRLVCACPITARMCTSSTAATAGGRFCAFPASAAGDVHLGPVGIFTLQFADPVIYPDLVDLPDQNGPRREEFRLAMNVDFFIYHEAYAPPEPPAEEDAGGCRHGPGRATGRRARRAAA